jgi:seryl-tRNA synthetase
MLEVSKIRDHKINMVRGLEKRNLQASADLDEVLRLDEMRRKTQSDLDNLLSESNRLSKEIGALFQAGKQQEANVLKAQTTHLKEQSKVLSDSLAETVDQLSDALLQLPNVPHESVKPGNSADDNEEIFKDGDTPVLPISALPHWELASKYNLIDFELGNKVTGAGFPVYKGKGAKLQRALIGFFLDENTAAGYQEVQVPHLVNADSAMGTGQLPDKEGQMYEATIDQLYLIPTAEVPITNLFRDVLLDEVELPQALTGYTPCFRREAGSYGAHVRGLNRLHQFDKVEIVRVEKPENSYAALEGMVDHIKAILTKLELPYRILRLCGGDMGFTSALTYDFEVYSAAQGRWLEISSVSNFETFQSNRLKLRFKDSEGKNRLAHTLNGSSLALPRVLAALLENNQTEKGITIPPALVSYTGFSIIQ